MVIQMISISSKLTSSDYPYPNSGDYPGYNIQGSGEDGNVLSYQPTGYHYNFTPYMFPGWLSKQFVIGLGRGPKVTRLAMTVAAFSSTGTPATPGYDPPYMIMNNWVEDWIPGAYRGGFPAPSLGNFLMRQEPLNIADRQISAGVGAALFKAAPDSLGNTNSYWCNQMLTNNQGIDFSADINYNPYGPNYIPDPDQSLAKTYHDPWALYTNSSGNPEYHGAIPFSYNGNDSPLDMDRIQAANDPQEWGVNTTNPGQMRCAQTQEANSYNPNEQLRMITTADGGTLNIGGGLSVHGSNLGGPYFSDPDPVPLETIRAGTINPPGVFSGDTTFDGVPNSVPRQFLWSGTWGMTGSPPGTTVRERHIASVVPVNINLSVPPPTPLLAMPQISISTPAIPW